MHISEGQQFEPYGKDQFSNFTSYSNNKVEQEKKQNEVETGSFEESIELRMTYLETQMTMFKTVFVREKEKNIKTIKYLEN